MKRRLGLRNALRLAAMGVAAAAGLLIAFAWFRPTPVLTLPAADHPACLAPAPDQDVEIGLAVSGGGIRAALFAAGAMEALAKIRVGPQQRSLLEQVSYISSVSGGSLASSYFVMRKPSHAVPMLTPEGSLSQEYQDFFNRFKEDMKADLEGKLLRHQFFRNRWFNPAWTARSLEEVLDESFLSGVTFSDLARREAQGDSPRLLINTTLYNNGRRFVLSTIPRDTLHYDPFIDLNRHPGVRKLDDESERLLRLRWEKLVSMKPEDLKLDICHITLAGAVVASMSFPPLIGPISFHIEGQDEYWHVGDGGLADNTGGESLLMVTLNKLQEGKTRRVLLVSLDSSFPFEVGGEVLTHRTDGFTLFSYDFSRIPSIMEERATAYRSWFLRIAQRQGILPDPSRIAYITLKHTDAEWKADLSDLPNSCRTDTGTRMQPREVARRLAGIATSLWIASPCDRDLTLTAAVKIVAQKENKIRAFLEAP